MLFKIIFLWINLKVFSNKYFSTSCTKHVEKITHENLNYQYNEIIILTAMIHTYGHLNTCREKKNILYVKFYIFLFFTSVFTNMSICPP